MTKKEKNPSGREVDPLKQSVVDYYENQLRRFGPTARGMDWKDEGSQFLRFEVLSSVCDLNGKTIYDVGCGAGHFYDFLQRTGTRAVYSGCDLSPRMIAEARRRHSNIRFDCSDLLAANSEQQYDVVLCSGLFFVKLDQNSSDWSAFVRAMVRRMYGMCKVAIAFNLMSDRVDFQVANLYYAPLAATLDFCLHELSCFVSLRHDYPLYEYTLYIYRQGHFEPHYSASRRALDDHAGSE